MKDERKPFSLPFDIADIAPTDTTFDGPANSDHFVRAKQFDERNPHVYRALRGVCMDMKAEGFDFWSILAAFSIVRFMALKTIGSAYKLSNCHMPYYARTLMAREPELAGFFRTRKTAGDPEYFDKERRAQEELQP
jgi:hypothetical protein